MGGFVSRALPALVGALTISVVIFLFMQGGPSQVDTFDHKEKLRELNGQEHPFDDARVLAKTKEIKQHRVFEVPCKLFVILARLTVKVLWR